MMKNNKDEILGSGVKSWIKFVDVERNQSWWSFPALLNYILDMHELWTESIFKCRYLKKTQYFDTKIKNINMYKNVYTL